MTAERSPLDQALDVLLYAPVGLAVTARENLPEIVDKGRQRVSNELGLARMIGRFAVAKGGQESRKLAERVGSILAGTSRSVGDRSRAGEPSRPGATDQAPAGADGDDAARPRTAPTPGVAEAAAASAPGSSGGPGRASQGQPAEAAAAEPDRASPVPVPAPSPSAATPDAASPPEPAPEPEVSPDAATPPPVPDAAAPALGHRGPGAASSGAHLAIPGYDALSASQVVRRLAGLTQEELAAVEAYERSTRGRRTILNRAAQLRPDAH